MSTDNENLKLFDLLKSQKWKEFTEYINSIEHIDLNIRDDQNNYLLTYAILYNQPKIVRLLIEKGARIDIVDNEDKSILYIAIRYDYQEIITILLEYNENNIGIFLFDIRDRNNNVPIHYTILFNNPEGLKKLLKAGASPNTREKNGYNSLHLAVYMRSFNMCAVIQEYNIDINARSNSGETALHIACNLQLIDIVKMLISNGINVNIQDYEHEYTALHYSVNLNSKELVGILLKNKADPNLQDVVGNTVIHYAVSENNLECLTMILASGENKVNLNLWNLDGKIAFLMALEIDMNNLSEYIDLLLPDSNLNIQDTNGNTCLHLICNRELWKEYQPQLIKKKLDVFLPNKLDERPIDYVGKKDFDNFLQMIVSGYLYRIRNVDIYWSEEWENMCKKELYYGDLTEEEEKVVRREIPLVKAGQHDICRDIIENKLRKTYERKDMKICSKSFPLKRGFMCIDLSEGQNLNVCTFTGSTLDILIGLIYLLNKHTNACSTFSRNFTENKELCKFYRSIGIIMNTRCEFLNFEVVWVHHKLYLVEEFYDNFRRCISKGDKQFVIIPLGIEMRVGSHANYLIYDKVIHEVERFEPHGSSTPPGLHYDPTLLDNILEVRFKEIDPEIKYVRPKDYLPKVGFQLLDVSERRKKRIGDPGGFCALWTIWYVDMRLSHRDLPRRTLVKKMIQTIKSQNISFKNLIRNYAKNIIDIRDRILNKAQIDINDWLNDQYNEHQIDIILKELTREVGLLIP
ncbi:MAG: ankyrin repeat protein [Harvfovirus sp.]|uniref:Ankyrin repeat protein n=1 Tax=Harvfovirus sp. TaxID=2487768 RepID=A0A3G5A574_9VIRU|nr:MAG: ankyrin repeat protein [Harvfovirus sp.]